MYEILDKIQGPNDIKKIDPADYEELAEEIREFLVNSVSKTGGHIASNLGAVELTMALHLALDLPDDKIIWDVGHQSYVHKLLTGRREGFRNLRSYGGMSGFPKREESPCDTFNTGHSSTSLSAALGLACARDLRGGTNTVVAVIGDGSLTGGMAYEALNNLCHLKSNLIIVLNDNKMSISESVGGLSNHLTRLRTGEAYIDFKKEVEKKLRQIPHVGDTVARNVKRTKDQMRTLLTGGNIFEDIGIKYLGPIDGHDVRLMLHVFQAAKMIDGPVLIHVLTHKGQGFVPAEEDPAAFHGVGKFDPVTGEIPHSDKKTYTSVFSHKICQMGMQHPDIIAITAAMPDGTGLNRFRKMFPERFFDVGIAEQHATTFAAGLAVGGLKPFFAVYSSFLQRAFDQTIHDVCIQKLPVVFCIDRAGLVGADGETHQGIFDLSYLSLIPNMTVCAPKNDLELKDMLDFAYSYSDGPVAIRYPRGAACTGMHEWRQPIELGRAEVLCEEKDVALLAVGSMVETAFQVHDRLAEHGIHASVINARFVKPLDKECIRRVVQNHSLIVTMEENVLAGGFGAAVSEYISETIERHVDILRVGINDTFVPHGSVDDLKKAYGLDAGSITGRILHKMDYSEPADPEAKEKDPEEDTQESGGIAESRG